MRSFSLKMICLLLLALCGLCGVQWWRESQIRAIAMALRSDLAAATAERDRLTERAKAADAEILRLNAAFADLRANSVPKQDMETAIQAAEQLNARIAALNQAFLRQNQILQQHNEAMQKANGTIQRIAEERDNLAKKANDITARYNALVKGKSQP